MFIREAAAVIICMFRQYQSQKAIQARQLKLIKQMIDYCVDHVPYYQNGAYAELKSIDVLEDLAKFPIIDKSELRKHGTPFFCSDLYQEKDFVVNLTSGTTGHPMTIYHDHACFDYMTATGVRRSFATGKYWPTYHMFHIRPFTAPPRFFERLGLFRHECISSVLPIEEIKDIIVKAKPDGLVSMPIYLRDVVAALSKEELQQVKKNLKIIFTESEMLTESHREYIESAFEVEIFDEYSAFETLATGYECSHHRFHIVEDRIYLEVVDDNGELVSPGVEGNLILTSFMERGMPLIRYDIGDRGILENEACPCGRTFKTFRLTQGRYNDFILLPDHTKIRSGTVFKLVNLLQNARECFLHQAQDESITFYYVLKDKHSDEQPQIEETIRQFFKENVSNALQLKIQKADAIPRTKGGKARMVHSEVSRQV